MDHHKLIPLWDERYNINHQKIDTQHQRLFEPAAQVENAVFKFVKRDELKEILTELFAYMKEHFHDEEEFMQEIQYPRLYEHKQMHKNIIHEMFQLIQNIKSTNDLKEKLYSIMSKWLSRHILSHDVMIIAWVNENLKKDENKALELNDLPPKQTLTQEENFEFIYSCPCKIDHKLSFKEHESITNEGKVMRCKKCQELLFFIRSQEKTYKG
ncbi:bacteriohemerythrin [Campylobacter coli]|nr:bacteriohemerythrin [Campylobacter coli]